MSLASLICHVCWSWTALSGRLCPSIAFDRISVILTLLLDIWFIRCADCRCCCFCCWDCCRYLFLSFTIILGLVLFEPKAFICYPLWVRGWSYSILLFTSFLWINFWISSGIRFIFFSLPCRHLISRLYTLLKPWKSHHFFCREEGWVLRFLGLCSIDCQHFLRFYASVVLHRTTLLARTNVLPFLFLFMLIHIIAPLFNSNDRLLPDRCLSVI